MKKLFLFTLGAFLLSGFQVHAQSPEFNAKLKQMMEISGANAVQRQLPEQMMQMMQQQMQQNGNQLPENTMQQMKVLFDNSFTQLMDLMVPIYAKYYTEEDLDNIDDYLMDDDDDEYDEDEDDDEPETAGLED